MNEKLRDRDKKVLNIAHRGNGAEGHEEDDGSRDGLKMGGKGRMSFRTSVERVWQRLRSMGLTGEVTEFSESTRTAAEAAAAIGTTVGQIAKSLVFMVGNEPVLVITS